MPRPYTRPMPRSWWLHHRAYFWFMMREFTAVFVAIYCVLLLLMIWWLKRSRTHGPETYDRLLDYLQSLPLLGFHFLAFVAAMFHTVTWFALVPKVMVVRIGEEKIPPFLLVAAHWLLWLVITAAILWLVFR